MNDGWTTFIDAQGAVRQEGAVIHYGDPRREAGAALYETALFDLSQYALVTMSGDDARTLLQGQLTNDVERIVDGRSQLSAWCSPQGRVISLFRLFGHASGQESGLYLQLPRALIETVVNRLRLYILRADVRIDADVEDMTPVGLSGPAAESIVEEISGPPPGEIGAVRCAGSYTVIRLPGGVPRFQILGAADRMTEFWGAALSRARPVGARGWDLLEIHAGITEVSPPISDKFLPQMLNLDILDAVSFTKGCYVGQEIVARTQHLGRLKRRTFRARVDDPEMPRPGDPIYARAHGGGQAVGVVVRAADCVDGGWDLLAVVQLERAAAGDLHLRHVFGAEVVIEALPYALP